MSAPSRSSRILRIAIILVLVFNLMALVVLIRENPIAFTLFMFVAQPLFALGTRGMFSPVDGQTRGERTGAT